MCQLGHDEAIDDVVLSQLISFWVLANQHPQEMRIQMTKLSISNQLEIARKRNQVQLINACICDPISKKMF